ncbi:translesion error-prone DNA polymerase V autoproteolytic subunit [Pseudomonas qingdaonensis]|jgi:DNA polymerase V|uniref:LexA family protein n=1 Tax=Pseudomonas TaxID=286 RepID=UPI002117314A|nr:MULTISPECIES: translesion error-prone DNA polymerase V autoproteolytic subunit [Pseudomonas]UXH56005.1 translesion error-prone DNA polymerase V autoproteolytic subunit [Pseudomonas aeruginosa]UXH68928.1 translesion error-prone DNA polymerase V autoproteolytic subunit [Pseudomonas aeruginosa]WKL67414.1 translesion error-prone DNA polymerase V autoproteolytic subunit [Pseudomonas qingdaonensis]
MRAHYLGIHSPSPAPTAFGGQASCGFPSPAADYQQPDLSLDQRVGMGKSSSIFLFQASGNSMTGAGIFDGDILVVDKAQRSQPGNVVLAIIGAEFLVKRLQYDREGRAMLVAENDQYPPLVLGDGEELEVWGVCMWVLHGLT